MDEVSNNVLLFLAILAIGISVFGIYTMVTNMGPSIITGADVGSANVSVSQSLAISISPAVINFTNTGQGATRNSSENTDLLPNTCTDNFCGINITNAGNTLIDIQLNVIRDMFTSVSRNASSMMCVVSPAANNFNKGSATATNSTNTTYVTCNNLTATGAVGGDAAFIDGLNFTDSSDNVYVDVRITVPMDEFTGQKGSILEFIAAAN